MIMTHPSDQPSTRLKPVTAGALDTRSFPAALTPLIGRDAVHAAIYGLVRWPFTRL